MKERILKTYNVHIYREMCLSFPGLIARTAEEAATFAAAMPSSAAAGFEDCNGENFAVLVGVVDSVESQQSWMIDFDPVRTIGPDLLTALELALPVLQEVVRTHLLSDALTARLALDRVTSVLAKARGQTA